MLAYIVKSIRSDKLAYQGECRRLLLGGLPRGANTVRSTKGAQRTCADRSIIQDGKLVGAVTHVMVADPTEGYGIFIENMLNSANNSLQKAA